MGIRAAALVAACVFGVYAEADDDASHRDLREVELSGDWYVLIHYKDDDSEDKSITKFKDFVWSIEQTRNTITWEEYPYVVFSDALEPYRRHAMREHLPWEPDAATWKRLREAVGVSARAMKRKRLTGSVEEGYSSLPPLAPGGFTTMTFTTTWRVKFAPEAIRIEIVDALAGGGLEGMEGATLYLITKRSDSGELSGRFDRDTLHGTFRMVRSKERKVVK